VSSPRIFFCEHPQCPRDSFLAGSFLPAERRPMHPCTIGPGYTRWTIGQLPAREQQTKCRMPVSPQVLPHARSSCCQVSLVPPASLYFLPFPKYRLLTPIGHRRHPSFRLRTLALLPVLAPAATQARSAIAPSKMRKNNAIICVRTCLHAGPRGEIDRSQPRL
jgi:hypothetical protein